MAEQTTIRADQIEGLADLIREQVRAVIYESKPITQDVEEIRRSPAGTVIRLEEQVKALDAKVDQRFDALKSEMDQRFDALKSEMDQRFDALKSEMDQRFDNLEKRFSLLQWVVVLMYPFLLAIVGKLFLVK